MKRFIFLILIICLILSGCSTHNEKSVQKADTSSGIWLTYSEINSLLASPDGFEKAFSEVLANCKALKIQNVFIHIRSHCDSIFVSEYFPITKSAESVAFDIFEYMIDGFHKENIKVHAWINPYRVTTAHSDVSLLNTESPAYKWLNDQSPENDKNICLADGIYLNPAEPQVRELIISGIKEVLSKYAVDGIHFDDYFYPTVDPAFDSISYNSYKENTANPIPLDDWRRTNVNILISGCKSAIKNQNENIIFSISPAVSLDKNFNELYADVEHWCKNGFVDWIIPQLYFGFNYPDKNFCFEKLLKDWMKICSINEKIELHIGLASYKIGTESALDKEEWNNNQDIIARQAKICLDENSVNGYVFFSYSSLFGNQPLQTAEKQNYQKLMKSVSQ